jgi:hypothetical protein
MRLLRRNSRAPFELEILAFRLPSSLRPHSQRLRWSRLRPPREWRNGRRAGLRIRCPKGRGSSTLPSRTPYELRIFVPGLLDSPAEGPSCSRLLAERAAAAHEVSLPGPVGRTDVYHLPERPERNTRREGAQHIYTDGSCYEDGVGSRHPAHPTFVEGSVDVQRAVV